MAETKKCPYCAEEILAEAIKCKHCHSKLGRKAGEFDLTKWALNLLKQSPEIILSILLIIGWFLPWWSPGNDVMNGKQLFDNFGDSEFGLRLFPAEITFVFIIILHVFVLSISFMNKTSKNKTLNLIKGIILIVSGTLAIRLSLPVFRFISGTDLGHLMFFISAFILIIISINLLKKYKYGLFFPASMILCLIIPYIDGEILLFSDYFSDFLNIDNTMNMIWVIIIAVFCIALVALNLKKKIKLYGIFTFVLFILSAFPSLLIIIFDFFEWGELEHGSSFDEYNIGFYLLGVLSIGIIVSGIHALKTYRKHSITSV